MILDGDATHGNGTCCLVEGDVQIHWPTATHRNRATELNDAIIAMPLELHAANESQLDYELGNFCRQSMTCSRVGRFDYLENMNEKSELRDERPEEDEQNPMDLNQTHSHDEMDTTAEMEEDDEEAGMVAGTMDGDDEIKRRNAAKHHHHHHSTTYQQRSFSTSMMARHHHQHYHPHSHHHSSTYHHHRSARTSHYRGEIGAKIMDAPAATVVSSTSFSKPIDIRRTRAAPSSSSIYSDDTLDAFARRCATVGAIRHVRCGAKLVGGHAAETNHEASEEENTRTRDFRNVHDRDVHESSPPKAPRIIRPTSATRVSAIPIPLQYQQQQMNEQQQQIQEQQQLQEQQEFYARQQQMEQQQLIQRQLYLSQQQQLWQYLQQQQQFAQQQQLLLQLRQQQDERNCTLESDKENNTLVHNADNNKDNGNGNGNKNTSNSSNGSKKKRAGKDYDRRTTILSDEDGCADDDMSIISCDEENNSLNGEIRHKQQHLHSHIIKSMSNHHHQKQRQPQQRCPPSSTMAKYWSYMDESEHVTDLGYPAVPAQFLSVGDIIGYSKVVRAERYEALGALDSAIGRLSDEWPAIRRGWEHNLRRQQSNNGNDNLMSSSIVAEENNGSNNDTIAVNATN